jgi:hypothetical protein
LFPRGSWRRTANPSVLSTSRRNEESEVMEDTQVRHDPLQHLEARERTMSRELRQLHRRIEHLQPKAPREPDSLDELVRLLAEEREISANRFEFHTTIDRMLGTTINRMTSQREAA